MHQMPLTHEQRTFPVPPAVHNLKGMTLESWIFLLSTGICAILGIFFSSVRCSPFSWLYLGKNLPFMQAFMNQMATLTLSVECHKCASMPSPAESSLKNR